MSDNHETVNISDIRNKQISRAQGCLIGQLAGDALGSLVEFQAPEEIQRQYPDGIRDMADGGTWDTIAGQPTDDSELALMLARTLVERGAFDREATRKAYIFWYESDPFDWGYTTSNGLMGQHKPESQANGAMMRVSPLGIFGANYDLKQVADWARQDAAITHIHQVCQDTSALFAMAIAHTIRTGCNASTLYDRIIFWAPEITTRQSIIETIEAAKDTPPEDYTVNQGWVLIAFQNALYQLLHASSTEQGIINTVMQGGDTDTNAAICGALLGAVNGLSTIPERWIETLRNCCPEKDTPGVYQPRPECFWPVDALELAVQLVAA